MAFELNANPGRSMRKVGGAELSRIIGASHLSWHFDTSRTPLLEAGVALRNVGPLRLAWVRTNKWGGRRTDEDIRANPEPYLTVLMPLAGSIVLKTATASVEIGKHELGLWDSTRPIAFEINQPAFEQLSVLVPQRLLRASAESCAAMHCGRVDRSNVLSELCVRHMATLARFLDSELRPYEMSLTTVTAGLFDAVISSVLRRPPDQTRLRTEIDEYIECYIADETLSARTIAEAFGISTRYVHKLFEIHEGTVRDWIINRRLERSATDLAGSAESITTIAFKWGFKDLAHYSRAFRRRFGVTPSDYRRSGGDAAPASD